MNAGRPKAAAVVRSSTQVIWQFASPTLANVVETAPGYAVYRDTGVAITKRDKDKPQAPKFVELLHSPAWAAIFSKWGWKKNCAQRPVTVRCRTDRPAIADITSLNSLRPEHRARSIVNSLRRST